MIKNKFLKLTFIISSLFCCINLTSCSKNNEKTYYELASIEDSRVDFSRPCQINMLFYEYSSYIYSFWDEEQCKKIFSLFNGVKFTYTCQSSELYEKYAMPYSDPINITICYDKVDSNDYYAYAFCLYQDGTLCFSFDEKVFYCSEKGCINFNNYVKLIEKMDAENRKII